MKNISPKIIRYLLIFSISLLISLNIIFSYKTVEKYTLLADESVEDGKRVIIVLPTEEIILKSKNDDLDELEENNKIEAAIVPKIEFPINKDQSNKSRVAILFVDIGKNEKTTNAIMNFADENDSNVKIGIAYSPYSTRLKSLIARGNKLKHEAYVYAPMETSDYPLNDPGEMGIIKLAEAENIKINMRHIIESGEGYKGIIGTIGETITGSMAKTIPVLDMIKKYKIALIYNERPANAHISDGAKSRGISIINKFTVIDAIPTTENIDLQLKKITENIQTENNHTLIVARPSPLSITRLKVWIDRLKEKNITISNVSELLH